MTPLRRIRPRLFIALFAGTLAAACQATGGTPLPPAAAPDTAGALAAALAAPPCAEKVPSAFPVPVANGIQAALGLARTQGVPGGMIGVVYRGKPYQYYWGYANLGHETCMTPSTVVEIGSITKTVTATLLAMAYLRNPAVNPNQHPGKWIDVLNQGNDVGKKCPPPPRATPVPPADYGVMKTMTLWMLSAHKSGLPDDAPPGNALAQRPCYSPDEFVAWAEAYPAGVRPAPTPPHPWVYSNAGFGTIGYVLQGIYKQPWFALVTNQLLVPLAMKHTYSQDDFPRAPYATGYDCNGNVAEIRWPHNAWPAAGSLRSTLPDMMQYLSAAMQEPGTPAGIAAAMKLAETQVENVLTPTRGKQAMAWSIDPVGSMQVINKDGATDGFDSWMAMVQAPSGPPQTGVVVLINRAGVQIRPTPYPGCGPSDGIPAVQLGIRVLDALESPGRR